MPEPEPPTFNLIDEPWITVALVAGGTDEVSIREVFHRADEIREVSAELPTHDFALTRLLLAVLTRAVVTDTGPLTVDRWTELWHDGLPLEAIDRYLDEQRERFDLLDPTRPFFQTPGLHTAKNETKGVDILLADVPSNNRLFSARAGRALESLSFAEAARRLVAVQAYDISGIKSGAVDDPRVKGGKGYPIGTGWSGAIGGLLAEGDSLRETLLLNFVGPSGGDTEDLHDDLPAWERPVSGPRQRDAHADTAADASTTPSGPVDLATWQSRRVRLIPEGDRVVAVVLTNGDRIAPQNQHRHEMMTAWRYSEPQSKKLGRTAYMPRKHLPGRAFWRGIGAILPGVHVSEKTGFAPGIVTWISTLQNDGVLPLASIRLRVIGMDYGTQDAVVDDILDDRLAVPVSVLWERHLALGNAAETAVTRAELAVFALRNLASDLAIAAGSSPVQTDGAREEAERRAYAALDRSYRSWLRQLTAGPDATEDELSDLAEAALTEWSIRVRALLRETAETLAAEAGPVAWAGRKVIGRTGEELFAAPRALSRCLATLSKALPVPDAQTSPDTGDTIDPEGDTE